MYKFIDLFCGIGGFRVALEKRGFECVYSSDIDSKAQQAYKRNFGEKPEGDITEIPTKRIPKHDILCAGFPCQSFSISGKQNGVRDDRGRLFYEIVRIAQHHQPYVLFLENVKNIITIDNGKVIHTIKTKLDEIGYDLHTHILNSSFFKKVFLEDILDNNIDKDFFISRDDIQITKKEEDVKNELKPLRVGIVNKGGQGERIYSPKGHSITISAYGGGAGAKTGLYTTNKGIRRLTIPECKKVMGFPKRHYVSSGVQGYQQLGNAVVPDMIGYVWDSIKVS